MWFRLGFLLCLMACGPALNPAFGAEPLGPLRGELLRVVDGDTVKMRVAVWIDQEVTVSVRLQGVDAPELFRPKCAAEKEKALAAKAYLEGLLQGAGGRLVLKDVRRGKYAGRVVARLEANGRDAGAALVKAGLAVPSPKGAWCAGA